jgi:adenylate cyclase
MALRIRCRWPRTADRRGDRDDRHRVGPGILQIDPSGNLAIRTVTLFATGKAEVSDNSLCINYQGLTLGRTVCGPVYRNSDGSADGEYPYTYVNPNMVFHFAMRE